MSLVTERCNNSSNCLYGSLVTVRRIQCPVIIMKLTSGQRRGRTVRGSKTLGVSHIGICVIFLCLEYCELSSSFSIFTQLSRDLFFR